MSTTRALVVAGGLFAAACGGPQAGRVKVTDAEIASLRADLAAATDPAAQLVAHGKLGEALWAASCPTADDGLCVTTQPPPAAHRCGPQGLRRTVATPRGAQAAEAREHFAAVIEGWGDADVATAPTELTERYVRARLALADDKAEALLAQAPPADEGGLESWIRDSVVKVGAATELYQSIARDQPLAALRIAAAAQLGRLYRSWADAILLLEVPASVRQGEYAADAEAEYCAAMAKEAKDAEDEAIEAWTQCGELAAKVGITGAWPDRCRRELERR